MLTNKPKDQKLPIPKSIFTMPKPANQLISFDIIKTWKALAAKRGWGWGREKGDQDRGQKEGIGEWEGVHVEDVKRGGGGSQSGRGRKDDSKRHSTFYTPNYKRWLRTPPFFSIVSIRSHVLICTAPLINLLPSFCLLCCSEKHTAAWHARRFNRWSISPYKIVGYLSLMLWIKYDVIKMIWSDRSVQTRACNSICVGYKNFCLP